MNAPRLLAAAALAAMTSGALVAVPTAAVAHGGKGKVVVHLVSLDGSDVPNIKLCPTRKSAPDIGKKVGKCDTTNKHGIAKLKHVLAGKRCVSIYSGNQPSGTFQKRVKVVAGKTVHKKYVLAG